MPHLGDYLGQILSEISIARMQADLETIRLAEIYAMHPLLRTFPVPRVRLPDVDLDIPVLIKAVEEPSAGTSARGGVPLATLNAKFEDVLKTQLAKSRITFSQADWDNVRAVLKERTAPNALPPEAAVDVHRVADDLTATVLRVIGDRIRAAPPAAAAPLERAAASQFANDLKDTARLEFLKLRTPPPRLSVLVTTAEVREGGAENLTRLRLKVTEQGVEWTSVESEGVTRERLVPE